MSFQNKVVVITGAAQGIGAFLAEAFNNERAIVYTIDKKPHAGFCGDLADQKTLDAFTQSVINKEGHVDILINNAMPLFKGIDECRYDEFQYALAVGVTAPFYLTQRFLPYFSEGASIINMSSTRDRMSQPQSESYTAAKGGIATLTHALAVSLAGRIRVNSISPGWIDTTGTVFFGPDATQHPAGIVGDPSDIAHAVFFLCSDQARFITGENLTIDGGMTKQMIYHGDFGWTLEK